MSAVQVLRSTPATLSMAWYSGDDLVDPGSVTVTIVRADGTAIVSGGATGGSGAAARTYALTPADTAALDILSATWTSVTLGTITQQVEIAGDLLFTIAELRAFHDGALANETKYPDSVIETARGRILDAFGDIAGVAMVPRYRRVTLDGGGRDELLLPDVEVRSVEAVETRASGATSWAAFGAEELADVLADSWGRLTRETLGVWPAGRRTVRVTYTAGFARAPAEVRRAALILARQQLVDSNVSDRATSMSSEAGTFALATAGVRGAYFGLPLVDSVLGRYAERYRIPGVA